MNTQYKLIKQAILPKEHVLLEVSLIGQGYRILRINRISKKETCFSFDLSQEAWAKDMFKFILENNRGAKNHVA